MPPDLRLVNACNDLLTSIPVTLDDMGIAVPDRRYIHSGVIAHDFAGQKCAEAFVVAWNVSSQGELGSPAQGAVIPIQCMMPMNHTFAIALLRCVPGPEKEGRAPSAEKLQASGEAILTDAMSLSAAIVNLAGANELFPSFRFAQAGIQLVSAIGPQGGVGGAVVQLRASLTG